MLARLTANFFRYQLARNPELSHWRAASGWPDPASETLVELFEKDGIRRLERLLELMTLIPKQRKAA